VQSNKGAEAAMLKLAGSGILLTNFVAADKGETAILSFSDEVDVRNDFTNNPDVLTRSLRGLGVEGQGACGLDALMRALRMLETRRRDRRRIILMIAEKRDRGSVTQLPEVVREVQRQNAAVYWLTFSPTLSRYTEKVQTIESKDPDVNGTPVPYDPPPMNIFNAFTELAHLSKPNLADLFAAATGGRTIDFLERKALEAEIHTIGDEVHRQYILSFQPPHTAPGTFHQIRVEVNGQPELKTKTRNGYWSIE
jgi:VWFA-related protein